MAYKIRRKGKTMIRLRVGQDVIYAKNQKEMDKKLRKGVFLWHYWKLK